VAFQNRSGFYQDRSGCHIETKTFKKHLGNEAVSEAIVKNYHAYN